MGTSLGLTPACVCFQGHPYFQQVVDLSWWALNFDRWARLSGDLALVHLLPMIVLLDFVAAFPSVAHEWLLLVPEALGAPAGGRGFLPWARRANTSTSHLDTDDCPYNVVR